MKRPPVARNWLAPDGSRAQNAGVQQPTYDWSPADNPYTIALSEAYWWLQCVSLNVYRIHGGDDSRVSFSSRQIDARQLVVALWQLRVAEKLQQRALRDLGMEQEVIAGLSRARTRFDKVLPNIQQMRNGLLHFDEWTQGTGDGPQKKEVTAGTSSRIVASKYSRFGYDPTTDEIALGPYSIHIGSALEAAKDLYRAIGGAARAVDLRAAADLRSRTVAAISASNLSSGGLHVSPGPGTRVWVSLDSSLPESDRESFSGQVIEVLAEANLRLLSSIEPQSESPAERLRNGEAMYVDSS